MPLRKRGCTSPYGLDSRFRGYEVTFDAVQQPREASRALSNLTPCSLSLPANGDTGRGHLWGRSFRAKRGICARNDIGMGKAACPMSNRLSPLLAHLRLQDINKVVGWPGTAQKQLEGGVGGELTRGVAKAFHRIARHQEIEGQEMASLGTREFHLVSNERAVQRIAEILHQRVLNRSCLLVALAT